MTPYTLKGISWNHSRAFPPLVASSQRFTEVHPEIEIVWEKRSLHEFGHADLASLCARYDLIVVDHPMMGEAHKQSLLVDIKQQFSVSSLEEMSRDSVGPSYASYVYQDCLYALPIDAAAPTASFRPDLLGKLGLEVPASWEDMLNLARRGLVRMPGFPADLFLNFMGLCVSSGATIAASNEMLVERSIALDCLELLRELACHLPNEVYAWNPIALYERMVATDEFAYCPFAYTYSNYARRGFAAAQLRFGTPVPLPDGNPVQTVLGGTGIAISRSSALREPALAFAEYVQSRTCQSTLYALAGGQPARRSAWLDPALNGIAGDFFTSTLPSMARAYVRPRYAGYVPLQEKAGVPIAEYSITHRGGSSQQSAGHALDRVDALFRESLEDSRDV
jgi:multiple sugar transport system substrate-binding protein